jgi:glutaryl-CoA dehydrogenase
MSLRASVTGEIVMDDVFVPEANLLPNVSGLKGPFGCLNKARYGIAWGALGAAEVLLACARASTRWTAPSSAARWRRTSSSRRSSPTCMTEIALGLQGCLRVGRLLDRGPRRARDDQPDQAQQLRQGARRRPHRARHAWRQRHP